MKVISLVDNLGSCPSKSGSARDSGDESVSCGTEHGLSLYIELDCGARVLFDMGQGSLFAENAAALGIDLSAVDIAVISHGHYDHAGGLDKFLSINQKASVYVRPGAFGEHFSAKENGLKQIGVDRPDHVVSGRLVFCREVERLPYGITLFSNPPGDFPEPPGNRLLLGPDGRTPDDFSHEQSMIVTESYPSGLAASASGLASARSSVLFGGCAHRGIANILTRAESLAPDPVTAVFSGMHIRSMFSCNYSAASREPFTGTLQDTDSYISALADSLLSHRDVRFWTMHCTGSEGFLRLASLMPGRLSYLPCGSSVVILAN